MDPAAVLQSRRYLSEISVWPTPKRLDLDGWIANFDDGIDREVATALLESHVHLDEEQIRYAVASTLCGISSRPEFGTATDRPANWAAFIDTVLVSFPLSRSGDSTASGYIFGRVAEGLGIDERRIFASEHLVGRLSDIGPTPVIFLDDLAASGTQFCRNWTRNYETGSGRVSLQALQESQQGGSTYYLPLVATRQAIERIEKTCGVIVEPTYVLDSDYGGLDSNTRLLPPRLRSHMPAFLAKYASRTGRDEYGDAGYGDLGLALSFHHSCPNNTLPVLQTGPRTETWTPWST